MMLLAGDINPSDRAAMARFQQEISASKQIDPQNALYYYLSAGRILVGGDIPPLYWTTSYDVEGGEKLGNVTYLIRNRSSFERAMQQVSTGITLPYCSTYRTELTQERFGALPSPGRVSDQMLRYAALAYMPTQEYATFRQTAIAMPYYGYVLGREGHLRKALPFLQGWKALAIQVTAESQDATALFAVVDMVKTAGESSASAYEQLGMPEEAADTRAEIARITRAFDEWRQREKTSSHQRGSDLLLGSFLPSSAWATLDPSEFMPLRHVETVLLEQVGASIVLLLLLFLLIVHSIIALIWRWRLRQRHLNPILLIPANHVLLRISGLGVLLPCLIYILYSQWDTFIERRQGGMAMLFLGTLIILIPTLMMRHVTRHRCRAFGIPVPNTSREVMDRVLGISQVLVLLGVIFLGSLPWLWRTPLKQWWFTQLVTLDTGQLIIGALVLILILVSIAVASIYAYRTRSNHYGLYYGTISHSLVPLYAAIALFISGIIYPCLVQSEIHWVQQDRLVFQNGWDMACVGTPFDKPILIELRAKMLQTLHQTQQTQDTPHAR